MKSGLLAAVPAHNLIYNIVCDMKAINLNLETIQNIHNITLINVQTS